VEYSLQMLSIDDLLAGNDLFGGLQASDRETISRYSTIRSISAGKNLFDEGDEAARFFILAQGEVIIRKQEDEVRLRDIARFISGETLGEIDVLRGSPRSARATATVDSTVLVFPAEPYTFASVLKQDEVAFARILHALITHIAGRIRSTNQLLGENNAWVEELRRQVYTDKLTGLRNIAYMNDTLREIDGVPERSVICFKPDRFKELNDTFGHQAGDRAIQLLAMGFRDSVGTAGTAIRYRGNEMVAILDDARESTARKISDRLHSAARAISRADFAPSAPAEYDPGDGDALLPLSASIGIALPSATEAVPGNRLLQSAYEQMMMVRRSGGGATSVVVVAASESGSAGRTR
jgi:diguanylate cyclase (GGDEF)-like protein